MSIRSVRWLSVLGGMLLVAAGSALASAAPGDLDPTFGTGGIVTSSFGATGNDMALQPDGKIVVVGQQSDGWAVSRFNADGSPDTSFGSGGEQALDLGSGTTAAAVAIQSDGKVVVVGSTKVGGRSEFGVARLDADGSLDTSFASDGVQSTDFGVDAGAAAVGLQSDGKIVAAGYTGGDNGDVALARYNTDGSLDTSFGSSGVQTTDLGGSSDSATGLAIQTDDKIVVCAFPGVTLRYTADGALDPTFADDGMQTPTFESFYNDFPDSTLYPAGVTLQPDGKIIVVGGLDNALTDDPSTTGDESYGIVRYNPDGSLDTAFSHDGKQAIGFLFGNSTVDGDLTDPRAVAVEPDGRIVVAGSVIDSANYDFGLIRLNPNGQLDLSFANDGRVLTSFPQSFSSPEAVAIQPDGSIVAAGYTADVDGDDNQANQHLAIARYEGGGPPPGPQPPRNITPPYIEGIGDPFAMASPGFWLGDTPLSYDYQWLRDGVPIPADEGGTDPVFYFVASADRGHQLAVQVTATNESGSAALTSASVSVPPTGSADTPPADTALPQITGTPAVGATLSASTGAWAGDMPQTYGYQWLRDGNPIAGATAASYVVTAADQGHSIAVRVVAANSSGSASATSASVNVPAARAGGGQAPAAQSNVGKGTPPVRASTASVGRISAHGADVGVQLRCSAGSGCPAVTATLSVRERLRDRKLVGIGAKVRTKVVVIGKATVRLAAGQRKQLTVRPNRTGRDLLRRFGRLNGRLQLSAGRRVLRVGRVSLR